MAEGQTFHLSIVTPERAVLECEARSAVFPAWDGDVGILRNRAPLLCRLGVGRLTAETVDEGVRQLFIDGGFGQMVENRLTILTEGAKEIADLDREEARQALAAAQEMSSADAKAFGERQRAMERARAALRLTGGGGGE